MMLLCELIAGWLLLTAVLPVYTSIYPSAAIVPDTRDALLILVFASVFTIGPFLTQLQALRTISAFTVNLSYNLEPIYSIVLAMLLFNEGKELNTPFWTGVFLIILSVVLQTAISRKAASRQQ